MTAEPSDLALFEAAGAGIARIRVEQLFGRYSYVIEPERFTDADLSRFLILYGDNGTGKTTILRLIYHLLSPAPRSQHRSFVMRVPFRRFAVEFRDGRRISAFRSGDYELDGPYTIEIRDADGTESECHFDPSDEDANEPRIDQFVAELPSVFPEDIYYIGDDRRIQSDALPQPDDEFDFIERITPSGKVHRERIPRRRRPGPEFAPDRDELLMRSLQRTQLWIREQVLGASNIGGVNSNRLYAEVARRIASPSLDDDPSQIYSLADIAERTAQAGEMNERFSELGLVPKAPTSELLQIISVVPSDRAEVLVDVLQPFVQGLEARLEALGDLYDTLTTFSREVNGFFTDKHVEVSVADGIVIRDNRPGARLDPAKLSSGEKQLLLLLTSTFYSRAHGALYIIDEPELSLNMKWQRRLVDALAATSRNSGISFVMASHSFELMAGARERVVHLDPTSM